MKKEYEVLFTPFKIRDCVIPNRFVLCPMAGTSLINWIWAKKYNGEVYDLLLNRAKDGVGLIIPGALQLRSFFRNLWIHKHPEAFNGIEELISEIHKYGSKVFIQITCGTGRNFFLMNWMSKYKKLLKPIIDVDYLNSGPDEGLPNVWINNEKTRALTVKEIQEFVTAYAETAYMMKNLGADGIEVHAVHEGYLMDSFTTPYTNHRTDQYGGSLENRYRFPCETVQAIKAKCGTDFPVILRYSVTSKTKGLFQGIIPGDDVNLEIGRSMAESEKAIKLLREAGYDGFNCDNGTYDAWYYAQPPVYMPYNCNLNEAVHIKNFTDAPIGTAGRMQLDESAKAIAEGKIDWVGIARQFLTDELYLTKIKENRMEDVLPCISCHTGCLPLSLYKGSGCKTKLNEEYGICSLRPYTRNEKKYAPTPARNKKTIAVIGGGVAGMEFALRAAERGHQVSLYEKTNELGGVYIAAAAPSYKGKDKELLAYYMHELKKSKVNVAMNTEIKNLSDLNTDEIVIATGVASTKLLSVPGGEKCIPAVDYLRGKKSVGKNVVVIGGGLTGCEIAYELALEGKKPTIVEMLDDLIIGTGISMANSHFLKDALKFYNVPVYLESKTCEIKDKAVVIEQKNGKREEIPTDSVILSIGYTAGNPFVKKAKKHVHIIGDANAVGNLRHAIWGANDLVVELSK